MPEHAVIRILLTGAHSYTALSDRFHIVESKIGLGTLRKSALQVRSGGASCDWRRLSGLDCVSLDDGRFRESRLTAPGLRAADHRLVSFRQRMLIAVDRLRPATAIRPCH